MHSQIEVDTKHFTNSWLVFLPEATTNIIVNVFSDNCLGVNTHANTTYMTTCSTNNYGAQTSKFIRVHASTSGN